MTTDTQTLLESYVARAEQDAILLPQAKAAAETYLAEHQLPGKKDERYKYTDVSSIIAIEPKPATKAIITQAIDIDQIFRCDIPQLDTHILVLINGFFHSFTAKGELPKGVEVLSFAEAIKKEPSLYDQFLTYKNTPEDGLEALNTLLATDGYFIRVKQNVVLEKPIQIVNVLLESDQNFIQTQSLIVIEEGATANIVVCDHSLTSGTFVSNSSLTISAAARSVFNIIQLQNEHDEASHVNHTYVKQQADSAVKHICLSLHGGIIRNNLHVDLLGERAENNCYGLFFTDRKQFVDNYTFINHAVPNCTSNQMYKGVLDEESVGSFTGRIYVNKIAQKTLAYQRNNNLLLSATAKMNSRPQLEIYADDVKCSHGATVGQLNAESMFYLRARGIGEVEARFLLMYAFAFEVLNGITIAPLRERIGEMVDRRLRGEMVRCHNCSLKR